MLAFLLWLVLVFSPAHETCQQQTADTIPTYSQCLANQWEDNGDH